MVVVGYLEVGKFFEWAAEWILQRAPTPQRLLLGVVVGGGLLSALFVNDTICLVVTPVLLAALGPLRVRPTPYLIGLAMGSNVGSVLSVTGNPQRSEEHTSELQSQSNLVCRLLLEKKKAKSRSSRRPNV